MRPSLHPLRSLLVAREHHDLIGLEQSEMHPIILFRLCAKPRLAKRYILASVDGVRSAWLDVFPFLPSHETILEEASLANPSALRSGCSSASHATRRTRPPQALANRSHLSLPLCPDELLQLECPFRLRERRANYRPIRARSYQKVALPEPEKRAPSAYIDCIALCTPKSAISRFR